jgi:hypothetical protein
MSAPYRTRGFHALAHDFHLHAQSEPIGSYFEHVLSGLPAPDVRGTEYAVKTIEDADAPDLRQVVRIGDAPGDDEVIVQSSSVGDLATSFVHYVNRKAIASDYAVICHAGGVERDSVGVVLPAHTESGKTTLTAGLVRAGFSYLSDEAVAFDPVTHVIEPYPKPLSIDAGSHHLFRELEPAPAPGDAAAPDDQWQVPPDAIRPGSVARPCTARLIVFPKYEADTPTELEPLSRATGLLELATNTFEFRDHARRSLELLAEVVRGAQCYRMAVGDLDDACALINELVDRVGEQAHV